MSEFSQKTEVDSPEKAGPELPVPSFISIGSNLGERRAAMSSAISELARVDEIEVVAVSSLYETSPVGGPAGQPPYLNAVALLQTPLGPENLLEVCKVIEASHGRRREIRWGPRTLDIDILTWGKRSVNTPALVVPHPRMYDRLFVLEPLLELAPMEDCSLDIKRAEERVEELRLLGNQSAVVIEDRRWWKRAIPV